MQTHVVQVFRKLVLDQVSFAFADGKGERTSAQKGRVEGIRRADEDESFCKPLTKLYSEALEPQGRCWW